MNKREHILRHKALHRALDELLADWIYHKNVLPSKESVGALMKWSYEQTRTPLEKYYKKTTGKNAKEIIRENK